MKTHANLSIAEDSPVLKAILNRRDSRDFIDREVPETVIKKLLYAAVWSPNHKLTEPWRFTVITSERRQELIHVYCKGLESMVDSDSPTHITEKIKNKITKTATSFSLIPLFIAVGYKKDADPETDTENLISVACGIQNILILAEEMGLSCHWTSGKSIENKIFLDYIGFTETEKIIGLLQIGYVKTRGNSVRSPLETFVRWL